MSATGAHAPNGAAGAPADGPLLRVRGLSVRFATPRGTVHAVSDVDLDLDAGRTLAVVGESGSGKSVLARSRELLCFSSNRGGWWGGGGPPCFNASMIKKN